MRLSPEEQAIFRAWVSGDATMESGARQIAGRFLKLYDNVFQPIGDRFRIGNTEFRGKLGFSQVHTVLYADQRYEQGQRKVSVRELNGDPLLASGEWDACSETGILVPTVSEDDDDENNFDMHESESEQTDEGVIRWMIAEEEKLRTAKDIDSDGYRFLKKELNHETYRGKIMYRAETKKKRAVQASIRYALQDPANSDDDTARLIAEHLQEHINFTGYYVHYTGTWTWVLF